MNYEQPELLQQIAGAYVLGTLRGPARARFARFCENNLAARAATHDWEDRLMPLLKVGEPVMPSRRVWLAIAKQIGGQAPASAARGTPSIWAVAAGLALVLIIGVAIRTIYPPLQFVAAIGHDVSHPLWQVARTAHYESLSITAVSVVNADPQRDYELWALPRDGKPPVSLGLLPRSGAIERSLTAAQRAALLGAGKVAVSLEPTHGSPTGQPTGPVLFVVSITVAG